MFFPTIHSNWRSKHVTPYTRRVDSLDNNTSSYSSSTSRTVNIAQPSHPLYASVLSFQNSTSSPIWKWRTQKTKSDTGSAAHKPLPPKKLYVNISPRPHPIPAFPSKVKSRHLPIPNSARPKILAPYTPVRIADTGCVLNARSIARSRHCWRGFSQEMQRNEQRRGEKEI
jgi:hypothetical protein